MALSSQRLSTARHTAAFTVVVALSAFLTEVVFSKGHSSFSPLVVALGTFLAEVDYILGGSRYALGMGLAFFAYTWCSMLCLLLGQPCVGTWLRHRLRQGVPFIFEGGETVCGLAGRLDT